MARNLNRLTKTNAASTPSEGQRDRSTTRRSQARRFTLRAFVFVVLALAAMLTGLLGGTPAARAQTTGVDVWSATLTAGQHLSGATVLYVGFEDISSDTAGSLSVNAFDLAGTSFTVKRLRISAPATDSVLQFALDTAPGGLASYLTLHIGSESLPLSDATLSTDGTQFDWTGHGLSWSDNDSVTARLTYSPPSFVPCRGEDCVEILLSSGLVPSGLSAGSSFRLLFVSSSTRDATAREQVPQNRNLTLTPLTK